MKGVVTGDPLPALREVRHLARLAYSTDIPIGEAIATTLLGYRVARAISGREPDNQRTVSC